MKKHAKFLLFLAVTLSVFYFIFRKVDYASLKEALLNADWRYLIVAALFIIFTTVLSSKKWQSVMRAMDYDIDFMNSLKIIMATYPVSAIVPAKAGDLMKAHYLKEKIHPLKTIGAVIAERLIDVYILSLYSLVGAIIMKNGLILIISSSIIISIPLFLTIAIKTNLPPLRWRKKLENFFWVVNIFLNNPKRILPIVFYSIVLWLILILSAKFLFLSLGVNIPLFYIAAAFPVAIFIGLIPITLAGMGTRDSAIIYLFGLWAGPSVSLGVGLLYSLFAYWILALLGLPIMKKLL